MKQRKINILITGLILVLVVSLPILLVVIQSQQNIRSKATAATTLSFSPQSSTTTPLVVTMGNTVSVDLMITPGNNLISFVKYDIQFDPLKITPDTATPFVINSTAFPVHPDGPTITNERIYGTLSIGNDPTHAIATSVKIATLLFHATGTGTTQISFSPLSQVYSVGASDQSAENVLSTTVPALIAITAPSPTPTITPTRAPTAAPTQIPTATPAPKDTVLQLSVKLHGIGIGGDNTNQTDISLSNKHPLTPQKPVTVQIFDSTNAQVSEKIGQISYNESSGIFTGSINLGSTLPTGIYAVKVKNDHYLRRLIAPAFQKVTVGTTIPLPQITLVAGDTNNDNKLNILDYNALLDCYTVLQTPKNCSADKLKNTDIDDTGSVNQDDYNLFLREILVQNGE